MSDTLREIAEEAVEACYKSAWAHEANVKIILAALTRVCAEKETESQNCPFCGGLGVLLNNGEIGKYQRLWVQCNNCGARGPTFDLYPPQGSKTGEELAWKAWSLRAKTSVPKGNEAGAPLIAEGKTEVCADKQRIKEAQLPMKHNRDGED